MAYKVIFEKENFRELWITFEIIREANQKAGQYSSSFV